MAIPHTRHTGDREGECDPPPAGGRGAQLTRTASLPLPAPFPRRDSPPSCNPAQPASRLRRRLLWLGREPREPGPGAETAAAPLWEEAKTFYDNLAPKKKPKSVKARHGFAGDGEGLLRERGHKSLEKGPVAPLWEGTQLLSPRKRPAAGADSAPAPPHAGNRGARIALRLQKGPGRALRSRRPKERELLSPGTGIRTLRWGDLGKIALDSALQLRFCSPRSGR
ncbi:hypothetical protein P7K49_016028 [Saguinus oedipus]|uniref:Uncharacterized protein n=1 Tax=Saguinus oedipus TaxID=9490 RepID=A0ABQ9VAW2_SAGOE|nr:hypothetical protein P7K49_016028 [Saguinus oedipus]